MANKMANVVITTGAMEGILSPATFMKRHPPPGFEKEGGGKEGESGISPVVTGAGAGTETGVGLGVGLGVGVGTGVTTHHAPFHHLATSEKSVLSNIPEDDNQTTPPVINTGSNNNVLGTTSTLNIYTPCHPIIISSQCHHALDFS